MYVCTYVSKYWYQCQFQLTILNIPAVLAALMYVCVCVPYVCTYVHTYVHLYMYLHTFVYTYISVAVNMHWSATDSVYRCLWV